MIIRRKYDFSHMIKPRNALSFWMHDTNLSVNPFVVMPYSVITQSNWYNSSFCDSLAGSLTTWVITSVRSLQIYNPYGVSLYHDIFRNFHSIAHFKTSCCRNSLLDRYSFVNIDIYKELPPFEEIDNLFLSFRVS